MSVPLVRTGDWLARTTMLVLAALATLALIGSLAGVSNAPSGDAPPGAQPQSASSRPATPPSNPQFVESGEGTMTIEAGAAPVAVAPIPERPDETARWLKALTYAVLALTAVAAAGVVALVRIAGHLRRLAER